MIPSRSANDIIKEACRDIITFAGSRKQLKDCRDAAKALHDSIDDFLRDFSLPSTEPPQQSPVAAGEGPHSAEDSARPVAAVNGAVSTASHTRDEGNVADAEPLSAPQEAAEGSISLNFTVVAGEDGEAVSVQLFPPRPTSSPVATGADAAPEADAQTHTAKPDNAEAGALETTPAEVAAAPGCDPSAAQPAAAADVEAEGPLGVEGAVMSGGGAAAAGPSLVSGSEPDGAVHSLKSAAPSVAAQVETAGPEQRANGERPHAGLEDSAGPAVDATDSNAGTEALPPAASVGTQLSMMSNPPQAPDQASQMPSARPSPAPDDPGPAVPRSPEAISHKAGSETMVVLRLACASGIRSLVMVAMSAVQSLVAAAFLQGEVATLMLEKEGRIGGGEGLHARGLSEVPEVLPVIAQALHLVCACEDCCHEDEQVEVAVLRTMLTIVTAPNVQLHGVALLLVIRVCYNVYIMSRSEVNQLTAKAALTQMVNVVFHQLAYNQGKALQPIVMPQMGTSRPDSRREAVTANMLVQAVLESVMTGGGGGGGTAASRLPPDAFHVNMKPLEDTMEDEAASTTSDGHKNPPSNVSTAAKASHRTSQPSLDLTDLGPLQPGLTPAPSGAPNAQGGGTPSSRPPAALPAGGGAVMLARERSRRLDCAVKLSRALCKLAMRSATVPGDTSVVQGRILALELLALVLVNHSGSFREYPQLMAVAKGDLAMSLLANCKSSSGHLQRLTCQIFVLVLGAFRAEFKSQVAYLFRHTIIKGLEPSGEFGEVSHDFRSVAFKCVDPICCDGQLLMDLFVNFDCDPERTDTVLVGRMFKGLINAVVNPDALAEAGATVPMASQARNMLRHSALMCLSQLLRSLFEWHQDHSGFRNEEEGVSRPIPSPGDGSFSSGFRVSSRGDVSGGAARELQSKMEKKQMKAQGIQMFNKKAKKGIKWLQGQGLLAEEPEKVAAFLKRTEGLDYAEIGEYLSHPDDYCKAVMHAYIDGMSFTGLTFDDAIRTFLLDFRLPGEAQRIDRLMEKFAEHYHHCNCQSDDYLFDNAGTAYVLAYSVIMLHTDQHNPSIKKRMTVEDFVRNNRGIDSGKDLPREFLEDLFNRIRMKEIVMRHTMLKSGDEGQEDKLAFDTGLIQSIFALFGRKKELHAEPTEDQIAQLSRFLKEKTQNLTFYSAQDPDELRPLVQHVWQYILPTLSTTFTDAGTDAALWHECVRGLVEATCLMSSLELGFIAAAFVRTLANFTSLHEPQSMKAQNAHALQQLLVVPERVGSHLHQNWVVILRCMSRWSHVVQVAAGEPQDLSLFFSVSVDPHKKHELKKSWWQRGRQEKRRSGTLPEPAQPGTLLDAGMGHSDIQCPPAAIVESVDESLLMRTYVLSAALDSEAIVEFFHSLTQVSCEELAEHPNPRIFSLGRTVDVCHHNMMRPRIVWTNIWKGTHNPHGEEEGWRGLSQYFVDIGCHTNLQVAMFAMDALRQVAEKFLERPELANMSFQNDFLTPFVVVMRQSEAKEIRELIIRQASRMVLSRVMNIKSGWKSMFMVFSQAAKDNEATIVRLAFDTVEKIVREHFTVITETDVGVFADCVNCLTAFTNQSHDDSVSINAISFLRFCASRLAEGSIGDVDALPEELQEYPPGPLEVFRVRCLDNPAALEEGAANSGAFDTQPNHARRSSAAASNCSVGARFNDHEEHLFFWMPLLIGLTELTFDPRSSVRWSALETLFDILMEHGACFSVGFWAKVFERMLLPIFDSVQVDDVDVVPLRGSPREMEDSRDNWLFETCSHCLENLIDLIVKFFPLVSPQLPQVLLKIHAFMLRSHHSLACVGVRALEQLITRVGPQLQPDMWMEVISGILRVTALTKPEVRRVLEFPLDRYFRPGYMGPEKDTGGEGSTGGSVTMYNLTEGLGLRRLQQVRIKTNMHTLLLHSCSEIYFNQHALMPAPAMITLAAALTEIRTHATQTNQDVQARQLLAAWQAEDGIDPIQNGLPDPPLMCLEVEAATAEISVLVHMLDYVHARGGSSQLRESDVLGRVLQVCCDVIERYTALDQPASLAELGLADKVAASNPVEGEDGPQVLPLHLTRGHKESLQVMAPVIVKALDALDHFPTDAFQQQLRRLFPMLTKLIRCPSATVEMQVALSDLFARRVGPLM